MIDDVVDVLPEPLGIDLRQRTTAGDEFASRDARASARVQLGNLSTITRDDGGFTPRDLVEHRSPVVAQLADAD